MTITNVITNPGVEVDLTGMSIMSGSTATGFYWRDTSSHHQTSGTGATASLRINNSVSGSNGVVWGSYSLAAGTYEAAIWAQILASTTNAAFVVRVASTGAVLLQKNWISPNNTWTRSNGDGSVAGKAASVGFFSISSTTTVEVVVGVGIYGAASLGSARFDELLIASVGSAGISTTALMVDDYFDGDSPDSTATTFAWTGTANASTSTATPVGGGSYQSFTQIFYDDFSSGTAPNNTDWYAQDGYKGTNGFGNRVGALAVISNGNLELRANGDNISGINSRHPITYGKVEWVDKKDPRTGYSPACFLWPANDVWGQNGTPGGELDLHEGNSNTQISSFLHNAIGQAQLNDGGHHTAVDTTVFHKYAIIWLPNKVRYLIDDVVVVEVTDKTFIPTVAMKLVIQLEVGVPGGTGPASQTPRAGYPAALSPYWAHTIQWVAIYTASTSANHDVPGEALEVLPDLGPGAPSILIDTSNSEVDQFGEAIEQPMDDLDTATGSVPGQPDSIPISTPTITLPACPQWRFIMPDGQTTVELTRWVNDFETLRGMSGWMAPPTVFKRDVIPGQPGQLTRNARHDIREIDLPLVTYQDTLLDLEAVLRRLVQATNITKGMGTLQRTGVDGKISSLRCYCTAGLTGGPRGVNGALIEAPTPVFIADDPYWYSETIEKTFNGTDSKPWFPWLPISLGSSSILGDLSLVTASDVPTYPQWTIVGPGDDPQLINTWSAHIDGQIETTTDTFSLGGHLNAGEALIIDTRPGIATVTGPAAAFGTNWFPYATERNLFPLQPGLNNLSLVLRGSISSSYISVAYRDRTLMP